MSKSLTDSWMEFTISIPDSEATSETNETTKVRIGTCDKKVKPVKKKRTMWIVTEDGQVCDFVIKSG